MPIIDVDAHAEPAPGWLADSPLAARLPQEDQGEVTMKFVAGDLLADVPREQWPTLQELIPPGIDAIRGERRVDGFSYDEANQRAVADPAARVAWLDANGIDAQNIICLEGLNFTRFLTDRALAREVITECNTWMADRHEGYTDRLMPVTALDFEDLDWTIAEMERMRARGSRAFLITSAPVNGIPPMHSHFDRLWSAAVDLGMLPILHIGFNPARFDPGWANVEGDMALLRQLGVCQNHQSVQLFLNGMVFGGVFERHPDLTVLIAECGIHWFAGTVEHMEQRDARRVPTAGLFMGPYRWSLSPGEFVRRNVRITPLPNLHQAPIRLLDEYPECVVFSSDYAHNEGNPRPVDHYRQLLGGFNDDERAAFLGGNIADCFRRMGDPLPAP
jgi:predicted TIM-barrel fold metal-dependent hydrolase